MTWLRQVGMQLILSFVLALILWIFVTVTVNPDSSTTFNDVPVDVRGLTPGLVIVNTSGVPRAADAELDTADVVVESDQDTLRDIDASVLDSFVDLAGLNAGTHTVDVTVQPDRSNVRVISVSPSSLPVRLEEIITRTVPITVEILGDLPISYEREAPEISVAGDSEAQEVQVSGPASQVNQVELAAASVNIEQVRATYSATLDLDPLNSDGDIVPGVTLEPAQANVRIEVRSVVGLKRVPVLGNVIGSPALGYVVTNIQSNPSLITLVGSSSRLNAINHVETEPIDINGATSTITREVDLRFRTVQPQEGEPETAIVTVQIASLDQPFQTQLSVQVEVEGLNSNLRADVIPPAVLVSVEGTTNAFAQLQPATLIARVDVSDLDPGVYTLSPVIDLPDPLTVTNVPEVTVRIFSPTTPTPTLTRTPTPAPTSTSEPTSTPGENAPTPQETVGNDASVPQPTATPASSADDVPLPQPTATPAPTPTVGPVPPDAPVPPSEPLPPVQPPTDKRPTPVLNEEVAPAATPNSRQIRSTP